jgi:hypothetical protein
VCVYLCNMCISIMGLWSKIFRLYSPKLGYSMTRCLNPPPTHPVLAPPNTKCGWRMMIQGLTYNL